MVGCTGFLKRQHVSVHEIQISAILGWDSVQVLKLTDVVGTHPAVLPGSGIACHAALVVASEKSLDIELEEEGFLFIIGEERPGQALLPADDPRIQCVLHKFQRLLLDVAE